MPPSFTKSAKQKFHSFRFDPCKFIDQLFDDESKFRTVLSVEINTVSFIFGWFFD